MQFYKNLGGNSNVTAFALANDSISIQFGDHSEYLYNYTSTGVAAVEEMKKLALQGHGLNSYINRYVKKAYARKVA